MNYLNARLKNLTAYQPGEQPSDGGYIKLNTNENPYTPSRYAVINMGVEDVENLRLYSDPECRKLCSAIAEFYGVEKRNVLTANGSDEVLAFCFAGFCDCGAVFPDVTYGFYRVFAGLFGVNYDIIGLAPDFTVRAEDYFNCGKTIFLANPNAQTGIYLPLAEIGKILKNNPNNVVVIDEAYIDFGGESAVSLIDKYKNLIVVQTFSKSRSLAGARVGFAVADEGLIRGLKQVKYSFNPYNVNSLSARIATFAVKDTQYFGECKAKIIKTRKRLINGLKELGFSRLPSTANFVLAEHVSISGEELYIKLKERGILVRHFNEERIKNFVRITVGTDADTNILLKTLEGILNEKV